MSDSDQIIISYNGDSRPAAESSLSRELRPVYNSFGHIVSIVHSWTISGDLLPNEGETPSASLLRGKLDDLITQFSVSDKLLQQKTTGGTIISELDPENCVWGPRLADVSFPTGADSVIPVRLPFTIRIEAESLHPRNHILEFSESVEETPEAHSEWQGGRFFEGRRVRVRNYPGYIYRQSGSALTLSGFIAPAPVYPFWQTAIISDPQIRRTHRPVDGKIALETTWSYEWAVPKRLAAGFRQPHAMP